MLTIKQRLHIDKLARLNRERPNTKVSLKCFVCGKEFLLCPSLAKKGKNKYCSMACYRKEQNAYAKFICQVCGKEFTASISAERKFCGKKCGYEGRIMPFHEGKLSVAYKHGGWGNKEFKDKYYKEYEAKNRDILKAYRHEYYLKNKEKIYNRVRNGVEMNRETVRFYAKNSAHKHRERNYQQTKKRRLLISVTGNFTKQEWEEIKKAHNYICKICKRQEPEIKLTIDHIKPIMRGGLHARENIQPLCSTCNKRKGVRYAEVIV